MAGPSAYELFRTGSALLEAGDVHAATVPLRRARDLEPEATAVREALGRALVHARRAREAAVEFEHVVAREPTNDYALFCLGRAYQMTGRHGDARGPLALAATLRPDRDDYRRYRDRARRRTEAAPTDDGPDDRGPDPGATSA